MTIKYRSGYKYQLAEGYSIGLNLFRYDIHTEFINLTPAGILTIKSGYSWDGASGPTIDSKSTMRGSLEHDALYQLMRMGLLPQSARAYADDRLKRVCIEDGMSKLRARIWHFGVSRFAGFAADPSNVKKIMTAP